jgi:hypothetical protein
MVSDVIAAVAALATVAAVIVALFQDRLRRALWAPRVVLRTDVSRFSVKEKTRYVDHAFVRLRVAADGARPTAEALQVWLLTCRPAPVLGGDGPIDRPEFLVPLRWAFTHEDAVSLAPGSARFVDVLELSRQCPEWARLTTKPDPKEGHWLAAGDEYTLRIAVTGSNLDSSRWRLTVSNSGGWTSAEGSLGGSVTAEIVREANG